MIPLCFPQALSLTSQDGLRLEVLPYRPEVGKILDASRVYLMLEETRKSIDATCLANSLEQPLQLVSEIMEALPKGPVALKDYWQQPLPLAGRSEKLRVCLLNGGGGGLGDAVMFAPALKILSARLAAHVNTSSIELHVYSGTPIRTAAVLNDLPGVKMLPLPLTLREFSTYDLYVDFSGMLTDESFNHMHMTDFALAKLGIDPTEVANQLKDPRLVMPAPSSAVQQALAEAHAQGGSRPLVVVIFTATRTRTMPEESAAALMRALSVDYQPVVILPPGSDGPGFIRQFSLQGVVVDLSAASRDFANYIALLAGMDAIISVDTSAVHIGAGLRKPTIGLFNSIDHLLRVRYSSTVKAIQLHYRGKDCQAPCGASKNRLYIDSRTAGGKSLRWEFGYACPESIDRQALLNWISERIKELETTGQAATAKELDEIRRAASLRFTRSPAPCWQSLDINEVIDLLGEIMAEVRP